MKSINVLLLLVALVLCTSFKPKSSMHSTRLPVMRMGFDIPLIPVFVVSAIGVFAVFNIDNKVDLTDAGRAAAKKQRRLEREARGEVRKVDPNADPYRYKWFEDDDSDDFDMINSGRKGGGCG